MATKTHHKDARARKSAAQPAPPPARVIQEFIPDVDEAMRAAIAEHVDRARAQLGHAIPKGRVLRALLVAALEHYRGAEYPYRRAVTARAVTTGAVKE